MSTTFKTAGSLLAGLVALSFAGAVPAFAQDYSFKFQSSDPAGNPTYMVEQEWAKGVEAASGGRLKIEMLPVDAIVA